MTDYKGIDYSTGTENRDLETGIHYGVIPQHEVLQAWADSSEPYYHPACPKCGGDISENDMFSDFDCPSCEQSIRDVDFHDVEPASFFVDDDEIEAECGESEDIFIFKSKYYTHAQFCSPVVGCLVNPCLSGPKTYCFGHDWFEAGKASYPVFSVETGEIIIPEK